MLQGSICKDFVPLCSRNTRSIAGACTDPFRDFVRNRVWTSRSGMKPIPNCATEVPICATNTSRSAVVGAAACFSLVALPDLVKYEPRCRPPEVRPSLSFELAGARAIAFHDFSRVVTDGGSDPGLAG